jgi:hypothetical protein
MDTPSPSRDPSAAQQLVVRYAAVLEDHSASNLFPAAVSTLPAPKAAIKTAICTVLDALAASDQLTDELAAFLNDAFVGLANYVDDELAALAAEHRRASDALEADPREPRTRLESGNWAAVARTSRLAGEIARTSADEASGLRAEFQERLAEIRRTSSR